MEIKMRLDLNFYLPVVEEITFLSGWKGFANFKYRFVSEKKPQEVIGFPEVTHTSILMAYYPEMPWQKDLDDCGAAVVNCMIFLNNFIDSYRLASGLEYIKNFTLSDLPPYIVIEVDGKNIGYTLPHFLTSAINDQGTKEAAAIALEQVNVWRLHRPFEIIDRFRSRAIHHLYTQEFLFAIVELQTSFETYIRMCHHIILESQGADAEDIEAKMAMPLKNAIEHHLSKGLDENLKISENPVMSEWNDKLYSLRNRIVHSGLSYILADDAYSAYDSYQKAINYLSDLMVRQKLIGADKMVDVKSLNKNIEENIDSETIIKEMKDRGIVTFLEDMQ